jgi:N6-adenosine-specific RNA methylase IME4
VIEAHPVADIFPRMSTAEYSALRDDIKVNGQHYPIWTWRGQIIDGRHRAQACEELGIEPDSREYEGDESSLVQFVVSLNLHRRHLDESQRGMVFARLATLPMGANQHTQICAPSQSEAAEMLNVSVRTGQSAKRVLEHGAPELVAAVDRGEVSVSAAATIAEIPKEEQTEIVARGRKEILAAAKQIRTEQAEKRREELAKKKAEQPALPDGKFETIVIDPPWDMSKIERDVRPNQVAFDYPTMTEAELAEFGVAGIAADDCHLFCWTTHKHLPMALRLLDVWGFRYVCTMVWHKPGGFQPVGLPQYNCEFALYARKGSPQFLDTKALPTCFNAPRGAHSAKPEEFYEVLRRVTGGRRLDMFNRRAIDGFASWGKEAA